MSEISSASIDEFLQSAVWRQRKKDLIERRTALYELILVNHPDLPEVIEIKLINDHLTYHTQLRDELKEQNK